MKKTPTHLLPESCFVCGGEKHPDIDSHNYWSNAEALVETREADRWMGGVEARYVEQTRGR